VVAAEHVIVASNRGNCGIADWRCGFLKGTSADSHQPLHPFSCPPFLPSSLLRQASPPSRTRLRIFTALYLFRVLSIPQKVCAQNSRVATMSKTFTAAEVAAHKTPEDLYIIV